MEDTPTKKSSSLCSACSARISKSSSTDGTVAQSSNTGDADLEVVNELPASGSSVVSFFQEVVAEGKALFILFLQQELQKHGFSVKLRPTQSTPLILNDSNESIDDDEQTTSILNDLSSQYKNTFTALQKLVEDFSTTKDRENVRRQANEMDLQNLTEDQYFLQLRQMIGEGITQDRVISLFCFCSDVAVALLKMKFGPLVPLISWSQRFLCDEICKWVEEHGGWDVVLGTGMEYAGRHGYIVAGGLGLAIMVMAVLVRSVWLFL